MTYLYVTLNPAFDKVQSYHVFASPVCEETVSHKHVSKFNLDTSMTWLIFAKSKNP